MPRPGKEQSESYSQIVAWEIFESYAKKVIRNKGRNLRRKLFRRIGHETESENPAQQESCVDYYPSDDYDFKVGDISYCIRNEFVYKGLMCLTKPMLGALVMYYWELNTDVQIGLHYGVSGRTIRAWRRRSIDLLRQYIRGESNAPLD